MSEIQIIAVVLTGIGVISLFITLISKSELFVYISMYCAIASTIIILMGCGNVSDNLTVEPQARTLHIIDRKGDVFYGDKDTYRDSTGHWHLKYHTLHDSQIVRIHY